ncbi:MAG: hypothetical protein R2780_10235 [Crocinitomicaceae bacterium]|nr:hypothetical protein [Crocinitomicaceae bacterium]
MRITVFTLSIFLASISSFGQDNGWMTFPAKSDSIATADSLDFTKGGGNITVHKDKRIEDLEKFVRSGEESLDGVLIDGFRVLIYFDQDKTKAEQQKAHFLSIYNDLSAYVDYLAPNYRVRVGNFRTKLEAEKLKQDIIGIFPTAIVVEDKIQLPSLNTGTDSNN